MKENEVPQDLKYYKNSHVRDLTYAIDENGVYKAVISDGWEAKNDALEVAWESVHEQCSRILDKIRNGETSTLEYYATKNLMTIELLSSYTGFSKKTIRSHYNPAVFAKLDEKTLGVYADTLRITIEELKRTPIE